MSNTPYNLTEEELAFENALIESDIKSVENVEERKKEAVQYAENTLKKRQLTIRPYASDIEAIKSQSLQL